MALAATLKKKRDEEERKRGQSGRSAEVNYQTESNGAEITCVAAAATTIVSKWVSLRRRGIILVHFSTTLTVAGACTLTCTCYDGDDAITHTAQVLLAAGAYHVNWTPYIAGCSEGLHNIAIKGQTSASSATIAIAQAQLILEAKGLDTPGVDMAPEIALPLTVPDIDTILIISTPSAVASAGSSVTIDVPALTVPSAPSIALVVHLIDQRYQAGDDSEATVASNDWECQTFTPTFNHTCNRVGIYCYRSGDPGTVDVKIYDTDGAGKPSGAAVASGSFTGGAIGTAAAWKAVTLGAGVALTNAVKYALVISAPAPVGAGALLWRLDASAPSYVNGERVYSADGGASWTNDATRDFLFEEGEAS